MKKRIVALLLTIVLLLGTAVSASAASTGFSDIPAGYWAGEAIRRVAGKAIVSGYQDGTFRPAQKVTNAQFAVLLARAFYPKEAEAYEDQGYGGPAPWYWASMAALRDHDILKGTAMGRDTGWPELDCDGGYVTRYDMAQLAYNIMLDHEQTGSRVEREIVYLRVRDWAEIPEEYQDAVTACYVLEVLRGHTDGDFDGAALMNRAQSCVVIDRLGKALGVTIGTGEYISAGPAGATLLSGLPVTEENVKDLLQRVAAEWQGDIRASTYASGNSSAEVQAVTWSYTDANGKKLSMTSGSGGYAAMLSDRVFGRYGFPARKLDDITKMRAGDLVITLESGKIVRVSTYSGVKGDMMTLEGRLETGFAMFYLKDGGTAGSMVITPEDEFPGRTYEVWTRYPE